MLQSHLEQARSYIVHLNVKILKLKEKISQFTLVDQKQREEEQVSSRRIRDPDTRMRHARQQEQYREEDVEEEEEEDKHSVETKEEDGDRADIDQKQTEQTVNVVVGGGAGGGGGGGAGAEGEFARLKAELDVHIRKEFDARMDARLREMMNDVQHRRQQQEPELEDRNAQIFEWTLIGGWFALMLWMVMKPGDKIQKL